MVGSQWVRWCFSVVVATLFSKTAGGGVGEGAAPLQMLWLSLRTMPPYLPPTFPFLPSNTSKDLLYQILPFTDRVLEHLSFLLTFLASLVPAFIASFLPCFLPFFLASLRPSFLSSFLPFLPSFVDLFCLMQFLFV